LWAKGVNLDFGSFWSWCRQADDSYERIQTYQKSWTRGGFNPGLAVIKRILLRFYPDLTKDRTVNKFIKSQQPLKGVTPQGRWLTKSDLVCSEKFVLMTGPMGTNKTGAVIESLDPSERILWVTPRISLSFNLHQRLDNTKRFNFKNYKAYDKNHESEIRDVKQLICCIPSLYKTDKALYDTVVLDEIETLLMMWRGDIGHLHFDINWMRFKEIIASAKKVYVMDAFMGVKTTNFLKSVPRVITGFQPPDERRIITYGSRTNWLGTIAKDLAAGKKLFVFYPYKFGNTKNHSMEKIARILIEASGLPESEFITYNSDSSDAVKGTLQKVNQVWSSKSCIICNTCITVGVNFDELHFDKVYAMWKSFVSQRDFFQNMYRCRTLKTNEVHLCMGKPKLMNNPWMHSNNKDEEYKSLLCDIACEENSKGSLDVFKLFAEQSGFVFYGDGEDISRAVKNRIVAITKETKCIFLWSRIEKMTGDEYEAAKHAMINSYTSKIDTAVRVRKYDFIRMFEANTPDEVMAELWDSHKFRLFDAIRAQELGGLKPADIIIRNLFEQNKCYYFLPEDPKWEYSIEKVREVFETRCEGEVHRYSQGFMASVLEAYFGMRVWESTGFRKHDGPRKYTVYESNKKFKKYTNMFCRYISRVYPLEDEGDTTLDTCLIPDDW